MKKVDLKSIILLLLTIASLIPNFGIRFSTFGFHWTFYRLSIPIAIVLFLIVKKGIVRIADHQNYFGWILLMVIWIAYGLLLLFFSPYVNKHDGLVELLAIINGSVCMYIYFNSNVGLKEIDKIAGWIYMILNLFIIFGIIEIHTGFHLPTSIFNDEKMAESLLTGKLSRYYTTGAMYGENDFSSFLTCLLPIALYKKNWRLLSIFSFMGVMYINYVNDANICDIAIMAGFLFYLLFLMENDKSRRHLIRFVFGGVFLLLTYWIVINFDSLKNIVKLLKVIEAQTNNYKNGDGSLWFRIMIYRDSVIASLKTGFIGIGPAAFSNYFTIHPSISTLTNPHNLYLEILVQYGLGILMAFIVLIANMIIQLRRLYIKNRQKQDSGRYLAMIEMLIVYSFACIASSSFLGYAYQWFELAMIMIFISVSERQWKQIDKRKNFRIGGK
ncbi:O-antigen ligase domain-containing protein [bacterium D16-54]|nr:O-antigen ligase domain-containing protein [bacterium D16-54]RKJ13388.1 O-antigen ligase domain-containing protein [bacterium D16-56]